MAPLWVRPQARRPAALRCAQEARASLARPPGPSQAAAPPEPNTLDGPASRPFICPRMMGEPSLLLSRRWRLFDDRLWWFGHRWPFAAGVWQLASALRQAPT